MGKERRTLFTKCTCDVVAALMKRADIIRRAFQGTGVGIDIEGKMMTHIRFPGLKLMNIRQKMRNLWISFSQKMKSKS